VSQRALSFGAVAAAYERFRPGYPDELVDQVLAYAGRPVRTALEIGAGTGKATRVLARNGVAVTATDPDPAMLLELRRHVPDTVTTVRAAFEDLPLSPAYDLVFAAASLHWTKPEGRWVRAAGMLAPGGIFASFSGQRELADPDLRDRVEAVRSTYLDDDVPSPDGTPADSPMQWPGTELAALPCSSTCASRPSNVGRTWLPTTTSGISRRCRPTSSCRSRFAARRSTPSSRSCRPEWRWWVTSSSISPGR